jgi:hypothetical protein
MQDKSRLESLLPGYTLYGTKKTIKALSSCWALYGAKYTIKNMLSSKKVLIPFDFNSRYSHVVALPKRFEKVIFII